MNDKDDEGSRGHFFWDSAFSLEIILKDYTIRVRFSSVQSLSRVQLFAIYFRLLYNTRMYNLDL